MVIRIVCQYWSLGSSGAIGFRSTPQLHDVFILTVMYSLTLPNPTQNAFERKIRSTNLQFSLTKVLRANIPQQRP